MLRAVRLSAFMLALVHGSAFAAPRREALLFSNCPRQSGEFTGSYRGQILLHKAFLDREPVEASIEHQLRYLWGHYRNDAAAHQSLQVSLSAEPPEIRILSRRDVPYGRDLPLPYPTKEERLKIEDPYTLRAVARGHADKNDPALSVEYEIHFKLAVCGRGEDPAPVVRVPLPPDPWLAYWYVDQGNHRPLRYFNDRAVTNPCADNDFADLPHPFYYWYDWLPTRHGPDDDGHSFDCRGWLKAGDHYQYYDVKLERTSAPSRDFSRLRAQLGEGPLQATILVGVTNHGMLDVGLESWRERLGNGKGGELKTRAAAALARWQRDSPHDNGTRSFLTALGELGRVVDVDQHTATMDGEFLVVEVNGKLKLSRRPIRARVWLGMTDIFGPKPPQHWRILRRALSEDQIILYWGHSGIGENFRLAQIEKHLGLSHQEMAAELQKSSWRLIAFLSCYSYMYFGQDLIDAGAESGNGGYFVFTGMESSKHEGGPLAVLDLVDRVLRDARGRVEKLPLLGDDEFWLIKEVAGAR
jgi:hypothetical protein